MMKFEKMFEDDREVLAKVSEDEDVIEDSEESIADSVIDSISAFW